MVALGGRHSTEVAFALLNQQTRVRFSAFPRIRNLFILDVAEINQQHFLECGKSLNILIGPSSTN